MIVTVSFPKRMVNLLQVLFCPSYILLARVPSGIAASTNMAIRPKEVIHWTKMLDMLSDEIKKEARIQKLNHQKLT